MSTKLALAVNDDNDLTDQQRAWDDELLEMESEKLYGLGSNQAEISQISSWLANGRLNLFPEYQREYVWKPEKSSRLVSTILCNRYLPPIVLHEKKKGSYDVVDGKQRLTSLLGFYLNGSGHTLLDAKMDPTFYEKLRKVLPDLKHLSKLDESYEKMNGLSFDDLSDDRQRAFEGYKVSYFIIPLNTPKTDVFEVYDDINSGGEDLTPQQVRRAVYYGPYITLLDDLAERCDDFQAIRSPAAYQQNQYESCPKHSDREMILRTFAFRRRGDMYKTPLKKFLNQEIDGTDDFDKRDDRDKKRIMKELDEFEAEFRAVVKVARNVFRGAAFRRQVSTGGIQEGGYRWNRVVTLSLWDAGYVALAELLKEYKPVQFTEAKDLIVDSMNASFNDGFFATDTARVSAKLFLERKNAFKKLVRGAITSRDKQRSFSPSLKPSLFKKQKGKCALCEQTIDETRLNDGTYVQIDHVAAHSKGGATIEANAQLTHSECNRKKGAGAGGKQ